MWKFERFFMPVHYLETQKGRAVLYEVLQKSLWSIVESLNNRKSVGEPFPKIIEQFWPILKETLSSLHKPKPNVKECHPLARYAVANNSPLMRRIVLGLDEINNKRKIGVPQ